MASSQAPTVDRIRFIGRPDDFLDRTVGNSGEIFFDKESNTLRLYNGRLRGGFNILTGTNLSSELFKTGVAVVEYTVTVNDNGGYKFFINGQPNPPLFMVIGYTYIFNQDDTSNEYYPNSPSESTNVHPLSLSSDNLNGTLGGGTAYELDVVYKLDNDIVTRADYVQDFSLATQRSVQITVRANTPKTLYYFCSSHSGMGNTISSNEPGSSNSDTTLDITVTVSDTPSGGGDLTHDENNPGSFTFTPADILSIAGKLDATAITVTVSDTPSGGGDLTHDENNPGSFTFTPALIPSAVNISGKLDATAITVTVSDTPSGGGDLTHDENNPGSFTFTPASIPSIAGKLDATAISVTTATASGGGNLTHDVNNPGSFTFTPADVSGLGFVSRGTVTVESASITVGSASNEVIIGYKSYYLLAIEVDYAAWVTVYTDTTSRTNDASRTQNTDPAPGAGIIAEIITTGPDKLFISPGVLGYNAESTPTTDIPIKVVNLGAATNTINVTLTIIQVEN